MTSNYYCHYVTCSLAHPVGRSAAETIPLLYLKEIKIKLRSVNSNEHIDEKRNRPFRGFGYLSLFGDPLDLAKWSQRETP